jgi:hypothetical protein
MSTDDALVTFLAGWQSSLARLQRAYPARWHVAGLSDEEVRDALTLQLLEIVRSEPRMALPDHATAFRIVRRQLAALRKSFRLGATPTDFNETPLQQLEPGLSTPQRRWLAAFKLAANGGAFFEASDEPNLSAASRVLGRHRSSAQRAYQELQTQFQRELRRSDD